MTRNDHCERVDGTEDGIDFDAHYVVKGWVRVAFFLLGWETESDEDTEWSGLIPLTNPFNL